MSSVQIQSSSAAWASNKGYRPDYSANDMTVFTQPRLGVALDVLMDDIRYSQEKVNFDKNRPGIASLILLAHDLGLVSETEIDSCTTNGWREVYRLYRASIKQIERYLGKEAESIAGIGLDHREFNSLDISMDKSSDGFYLYLTTSMRFSQFTLVDLDNDLGRMIYGCLDWIVRDMGFGIMANDLFGASMMMDEEIECFNKLRQQHPTGTIVELATLAMNDEESIFSEIYDFDDTVCRLEFLKSIVENSVESIFGNPPTIPEIRKKVIEWRKSNKENYNSPWIKFIKETIHAWKSVRDFQCAGSGLGILEHCEGEIGDIWLDYGHAIGIGLPWEEEIVDGIYQDTMQTGEFPLAKIKLQPIAISKIGERLKMLAKARGLIRLAEVINYPD